MIAGTLNFIVLEEVWLAMAMFGLMDSCGIDRTVRETMLVSASFHGPSDQGMHVQNWVARRRTDGHALADCL